MRFYLVDRITQIEHGASIEGIKAWTLSENYFEQHFPGYPVVPGTLLIESMAQILGYLGEISYEKEFCDTKGVYVLLTIIHRAKFRDYVIPGDQCILKGRLKSLDKNRCSGSAEVYVNKKRMAEAELSFIIIQQHMLPPNKYISKRDEYNHILTQERQRGT
ncbi:MAG: beta-hydroxyacyl-ACP dehydratase [Bacteroidetes bacterium]|jgi:3-hydroxyacyl-[acyl-carrier-protein] dehydratase|nr:beta-hydroxyacyl-ACP dehydratase [Bacteroidota bacterium]MBT3749436.1 beta-hydroxyacyl-ACP dehydratase [Bacteroidota bacterium]MBT4398808.1 beta-hydroxyacyl-ACP dehydratase [Bacteroidota bacterium]MBT4411994.1 beta-hydroxyacyl-ACP dehydratase [Bacteroidota bacterium]MBT5425205.1 beta-hydroxyacyl-ACP dehydratase [Bacteroidota bacterium]